MAKSKYKTTDKGKASNAKWVSSDRRKENERRYRQQPRSRALAVQSNKRYLQNHPEAMEKKRERDVIFGRTERGREINRIARTKYGRTEKGRLQKRIAKSKRRNAEGSFTANEWQYKLREYGYRCAHCGAAGNLEIDHIQPIKLGGANTIVNLQPLCRSCNARKGARYVG